MKICAITCTKGRHRLLERSVRMFLEQDYSNSIQLIYNNACTAQRLNKNLPSERFILINNCIDTKTDRPYTTLGAIYTDAIKYIPDDVDVICFMDDDDLFFPTHFTEGIKGLIKGGKTAYKPEKSYFKSGQIINLISNTLEPSIFVKKDHILKYGFGDNTVSQHLQWVVPLVDNREIFVDPEGKPTLIYTWGERIPTFKTSGDPNNPNNFNNYAGFSIDHGDKIITPVSKDIAFNYFMPLHVE